MPLFAARLTYGGPDGLIQEVRPSHRAYLKSVYDRGKLAISGPLAGDVGAIVVYDADDKAEAEELLANDPFVLQGVAVETQLDEWGVVFIKEMGPLTP